MLFIEKYKKNVLTALEVRTQAKTPKMLGTIIIMAALTIAYLVRCALVRPDGQPVEFHFVQEWSPLVAYTFLQFSLASAFAFATYLVLHFAKNPHKLVWLLLSMALAFLAMDEILEIHEKLGNAFENRHHSTVFRNWNDLIVIIYGVIAAGFTLWYLPSLIRFRLAFELFCIAGLFYVIHTSIDALVDPATSVSIILEESNKAFSSVFLMLASITGFLMTLRNEHQNLQFDD